MTKPFEHYDYILSQNPNSVPFFARKGVAGGAGGPQIVHLDLNEFNAKGLGAQEAKSGFMSVFFDHYDALCPGGIDIHAAIEEMGLEDIIIDDGNPATRREAFGRYQFTYFCGDFHLQPYPPQPLIDTFIMGTLPLVPYDLYKDMAKFHFHLPDAAQGVKRLRLKMAEAYLR